MNLPGFYFDEEKRRYFPITGKIKQDLKRRKIEQTHLSGKKKIDQDRLDEYKKTWISRGTILDKNFNPVPINIIRQRAINCSLVKRDMYSNVRDNKTTIIDSLYNRSIQINIVNGVIESHDELGITSFVSDDRGNVYHIIEKENSDTNVEMIFSSNIDSDTPVQSTLRFENGELLHYLSIGQYNRHIHIFTSYSTSLLQTTLSPVRRFQDEIEKSPLLLDFQYAYNTLCFSVGNRVIVKNMANTSLKPEHISLYSGKRSDVTALTLCQNPPGIYAGTRSGHLHYLNMSRDGSIIHKVKPLKNPAGIDSIVSLHLFPGNKIIISGIKQSHTGQLLVIFDKFTNSWIQLKTTFQNITKDNEICSISKDGIYVCYGRKGAGFELFTASLANISNNIFTCDPIGDTENYIPSQYLSDYNIIDSKFVSNGKRMSVMMQRRDNYMREPLISISIEIP